MEGITLQIPLAKPETFSLLREIEEKMKALGITFDTGVDITSGIREWHLDWSLKGATIKQ
jgi:hypothetical protein